MNLEIQKLYDKLTEYSALVSNWTLRSFDMFDTSTPKDVLIKTVDNNGNLVETLVPNLAKTAELVSSASSNANGAVLGQTVAITTTQELVDTLNGLSNLSFLGPVILELDPIVFETTVSIDIIGLGNSASPLIIRPKPGTSATLSKTFYDISPLLNIVDSRVIFSNISFKGRIITEGTGCGGIYAFNSFVTVSSSSFITCTLAIKSSDNSVVECDAITGAYCEGFFAASTNGRIKVLSSDLVGQTAVVNGSYTSLGSASSNGVLELDTVTAVDFDSGITASSGGQVTIKSGRIDARVTALSSKGTSVIDVESLISSGGGAVGSVALSSSNGGIISAKSINFDSFDTFAFILEGGFINISISNVSAINVSAFLCDGGEIYSDNLTLSMTPNAVGAAPREIVKSITNSVASLEGANITCSDGDIISSSLGSLVLCNNAVISNPVLLSVGARGFIGAHNITGAITSNIALNTITVDGHVDTNAVYQTNVPNIV